MRLCGIIERKAVISRTHRSSVTKQAKVSAISRGSVYYPPWSVRRMIST
jgi:hypothetical protein